jgi:hypothetical protein
MCDPWAGIGWMVVSWVMLIMGYIIGRAHASDLQKHGKG